MQQLSALALIRHLIASLDPRRAERSAFAARRGSPPYALENASTHMLGAACAITPTAPVRSRKLRQPIANEAEQQLVTGAAGSHQRAMNRLGPIVDQRSPRKTRDQPAGFVHQKIGCRKVPIVAVGGSKGAIERAGGNARKPQGERGNSRRGHDARLDRCETVEPTLGAGER